MVGPTTWQALPRLGAGRPGRQVGQATRSTTTSVGVQPFSLTGAGVDPGQTHVCSLSGCRRRRRRAPSDGATRGPGVLPLGYRPVLTLGRFRLRFVGEQHAVRTSGCVPPGLTGVMDMGGRSEDAAGVG